MKKTFLLFFSVLWAAIAIAGEFHDQQAHPSCSYCGMDRTAFAHSRMLVEYADGGAVGTCSLHCMALEFATALDRTPKRLLVADFNSHELIEAEKATWVLGGDRQGVMSSRAKWAFSESAGAEEFVAGHGGEIVDFHDAMTAAYTDMYQDVLRIRQMRAMKKHQMRKQ